jgi:penicillin amidase
MKDQPTAFPPEQIHVAGLTDAAEIIVDSWGIPHLRAANKADLFFLQGFNAARDRLWQIDLWRKRGLGLLARDFGAGYLAQDRASRAFLFHGDMAQEWVSYAPDAKEITTSFVAGINAYVDFVAREPQRLPAEFAITGTGPDRWAPEDVVRIRSHALTRNALSEVLRAQIAPPAGDDVDLLRKFLEPAHSPRPTDGLDPSEIPLAVLDLFKLATAQVTFSPERLAAPIEQAEAWSTINDQLAVIMRAEWTGSNNWAVAPHRTATGRAIMAADPHRNHAMPSLRYIVHLSAPGINAIGAGEPSVPGVSMGHNERIAFSQTIFGSDQEDVYVYELDPKNHDRYCYGDGWRMMELREERFAIRGAPDRIEKLRFTHHGPVLYVDALRHRAFALRSVWSEPGSAAYLAGLSSMRASNLTEFRDAIARFATPSLNHVYADVDGTIAWLPFGMTPRRRNWDGLLPVPGDGRFEWDGFLRLDQMPCAVNPPDGFVYSANEANVPQDFDDEDGVIGYEWLEKSRALRIRDVLSRDTRHTIDASAALQTDTFSWPAHRLRPLIAQLSPPAGSKAAKARELLLAWNGELGADSVAGALSELWFTWHLKPKLFESMVPDKMLRALLAPGDVEGILTALETPGRRFGHEPQAGRDLLLIETLSAAWDDARKRLGDDPAAWAWGRLHHGYFEHPLSSLVAPERRAALDVGPLPKGGSASTVMHAAYRPSDFRVTMGASVRLLMDVGDWDASRCVNAPGQSGDSQSSHYSDLSKLWAKGDYVPLLFSTDAVDAAASRRIMLVPLDRDQDPAQEQAREQATE